MSVTIEVSHKKIGTYPVIITSGYEELGDQIKAMFPSLNRICIISDSNVLAIYGNLVISALKDCCRQITEYVFEPGEESKNLSTIRKCYDKLLENDFNRRDLIIGLGGGIAGDMAAFTAGTYMRGCRFVNLPTSLLAMADSSVGGKCGVNFDKYKNLIGIVNMPDLVYIATNSLSSLPEREFSSGMAEILKAGLIKDGSFYEWLIQNFDRIMDRDPGAVEEMLRSAVGIKQFFVTRDPFEKGERMILNFGHTTGHALEKYFNFRYSHGECVCLGIIAASYISYKRSMLTDEEFYEIRDMFVPFGLPISLDPFDIDEVIRNIGHDKKNTDTGLSFILLKKPGKAVISTDVTTSEIREALQKLIVEYD